MGPEPFFLGPRSNLPWYSGGFGRPEGRGEMNCGNLGEEYGRRDFPGDINNFHCLTKHSAKRSDHDREKNKYILFMVKQI